MANFSTYYPKLLVYEGGYASAAYAAKMGDKGGETYLGIARNYNKTWPGWAIIDAYKAKNGEPRYNSRIDDPELYQFAEALTKKTYWDKLSLDAILSQSLAEQIMDFGFNSGLATSARGVQKLLSLPLTGFFARADLQSINKADAKQLFSSLQQYRIDMITNSTKIDPRFKKGLIARAQSFTFDDKV